ncbi:MAG: GntR family transcriptional regulator [Thermovirgaceae bacterium]|nr:GntR family transcriptional regulator [Thermovirgaceae bacterium]
MQLSELISRESDKSQSTPVFVVNVLREAILRGLIPPGKILRQGEIAAELGLSHIPVREAMRQLEAEGFVEIIQNRGAVVKGLTSEDAMEIFSIRILIESEALRLAMPGLDEKIFRKCEFINSEIGDEQDVHRWCGLNWDFHKCLYEAAQSPRLLQLIQNLYSNVDRYLRIYLEVEDYRSIGSQEHASILEACRAGDADLAVAALRLHLENSRRLLVNLRDSKENNTQKEDS